MAKIKARFKRGDRICWRENPEEPYIVQFVSHKKGEYKAISETNEETNWIPFNCAERYRIMRNLIGQWVRVFEKGFDSTPYYVEDLQEDRVLLLHGPVDNFEQRIFPNLTNLTVIPVPKRLREIYKRFSAGDRVNFKGQDWTIKEFGEDHGLPVLSRLFDRDLIVPLKELDLLDWDEEVSLMSSSEISDMKEGEEGEEEGIRATALGEAMDRSRDRANVESSQKISGLSISFAKTLPELLFGNKTQTRRNWSDSHVAKFRRAYYKGELIRALNKDRRAKNSEQVGLLRLTAEPYEEVLADMNPEDLAAEGFSELSKEEFINKFFKGDERQVVSVIKFEFFPTRDRAAKVLPQTKDSDENYTPNTESQPVVNLVAAALGGAIGLDPTADPDKRIPAANHFTADDNCLNKSWEGLGSVFMNPPYSKPLPFIEKLCKELEAGHVPNAIALLKAGTVNNKKSGALIAARASAICHWRSPRIGFISAATGEQRRNADFDCCLVYFGDDSKLFQSTFDPWGTVSLLANAQTDVSFQTIQGVANAPTKLKLSEIVLNEEFQPREKIDEETIERYYNLLLAGIHLPPATVYEIEGVVYLGDGWHRREAHLRASFPEMAVKIVRGLSMEAAIAHSQLANRTNGLPLVKSDIKRAVIQLVKMRSVLSGEEVRQIIEPLQVKTPAGGYYRNFSNRAIAALFGVNHRTVATYENEYLIEEAANGRLRPGTIVQLSPEAADKEKIEYGSWQATGTIESYSAKGFSVKWNSVRVKRQILQPEELLDLIEEPEDIKNYKDPSVGDRVFVRDYGDGVVVADTIPGFCSGDRPLAILTNKNKLVCSYADRCDNEGAGNIPAAETIIEAIKLQIADLPENSDKKHAALLAAISFFRRDSEPELREVSGEYSPLATKKASKNGELKAKGESLGMRERNGQLFPNVERRDACPPELEVNECQVTSEQQTEAMDRELADPLFSFETLCDRLSDLDDERLKTLFKSVKAELTRRHRPKQEGDPALLQTDLAVV